MGNVEANSLYKVENDFDSYDTDNWTVKKCTFNGHINSNATLFSFEKSKSKTDFSFILNQIRVLKILRHPNVVKYLHSFEQLQSQSCILITESILPLRSFLNEFKYEQIVSGFYGITCAIEFLHNKALLSHNDICEKNLYINSKFVWKLNGFELSLNFSSMTRDNVLRMKPFKSSNLAPEEQSERLEHLASQKYHHAIDVYCWALMLNELLNSQSCFLTSDSNDDFKYLQECLDENPTKRPKIEAALELSLFKASKLVSNNQQQQQYSETQIVLLNEQLALIAEFNTNENYSQQENETINKLISYVEELVGRLEDSEQEYDYLINENFISFLLQPIMFFSSKIRNIVLPAVLRPKSDLTTSHQIKPFINENKYKAYVLPKIMSLFFVKIFIVRLVLLDYFQYYVNFIRNTETLRYEILPELLLGLKDNNDELASKTFSCLAIMVKLLGSKVVIGSTMQNEGQKFKIFSDNLPKLVTKTADFESVMRTSNSSFDDIKLGHTAEIKLKQMAKSTSDSMIALNDFKLNDTEIEDNGDDIISELNHVQQQQHAANTDWSNDFNDWNNDEDENYEDLNEQKNQEPPAADLPSPTTDSSAKSFSLKRPLPIFQPLAPVDLGSEYDIKSIKLKVNKANEMLDDLFNDMQPVIQKTIKNTLIDDLEEKINESNSSSKFSVIETLKADQSTTTTTTATAVSWDTDDIEIENTEN